MAKRSNKAFDYAVYLALRLVETLIHTLPLETSYGLARRLGDALHRFDRRHRDRAADHIRQSFPEWEEARVQDVCRGAMRNMIYLGLEALLTRRRITKVRWRKYIHVSAAAEALRMATERKGPLIFLTGHLGNFEVTGHTMALLGYPGVALARRLDNPYLDRHLIDFREAAGQKIVDKRGAMEAVPKVLADGGIVSIIADQDAGPKGVFVDFFGRPASTYKSFGLMAIRYDAPIIVGFGHRIGERYEFELICQKIIRPEEWAHQADPLHWITREYTRALENAVRLSPEQYFWVYRRWKSQPREKGRG